MENQVKEDSSNKEVLQELYLYLCNCDACSKSVAEKVKKSEK